jgi:hypothetical protein
MRCSKTLAVGRHISAAIHRANGSKPSGLLWAWGVHVEEDWPNESCRPDTRPAWRNLLGVGATTPGCFRTRRGPSDTAELRSKASQSIQRTIIIAPMPFTRLPTCRSPFWGSVGSLPFLQETIGLPSGVAKPVGPEPLLALNRLSVDGGCL